eukprot:2053992-Prymnesium_polylepis.1
MLKGPQLAPSALPFTPPRLRSCRLHHTHSQRRTGSSAPPWFGCAQARDAAQARHSLHHPAGGARQERGARQARCGARAHLASAARVLVRRARGGRR